MIRSVSVELFAVVLLVADGAFTTSFFVALFDGDRLEWSVLPVLSFSMRTMLVRGIRVWI